LTIPNGSTGYYQNHVDKHFVLTLPRLATDFRRLLRTLSLYCEPKANIYKNHRGKSSQRKSTTFFEGKEIGSQSGWGNAFSINLHNCKLTD